MDDHHLREYIRHHYDDCVKQLQHSQGHGRFSRLESICLCVIYFHGTRRIRSSKTINRDYVAVSLRWVQRLCSENLGKAKRRLSDLERLGPALISQINSSLTHKDKTALSKGSGNLRAANHFHDFYTLLQWALTSLKELDHSDTSIIRGLIQFSAAYPAIKAGLFSAFTAEGAMHVKLILKEDLREIVTFFKEVQSHA